MKRTIGLAAVIGLLATGSVFAQAAQPDPKEIIYRQLLDQANSNLVETIVTKDGQVAALKKQVDDLTKELAEAKDKHGQ